MSKPEMLSLRRVKSRIKTADEAMNLLLDSTTDMVRGTMPIEMAAQVSNAIWKVAKIAALQHRFGEYDRESGDFTWTLVRDREDDE